MKKIKKAVLIIMAVLMAGNLAGCSGTNWKDVQNTMVQKLDKKYGGEFVVTDVAGGRTLNTQASSNYTATAYPKGKPKENFEVWLSCDMKDLSDGYVDLIMFKRYNAVVLKKAQVYWKDCHANTYTSLWGNAPASDLNLDIEQYIAKWQPWVTSDILVKSDGSISKEKEADKIYNFEKSMTTEKFSKLGLRIYYVKDNAYTGIMDRYSEDSDKALSDKALIECSAGVSIYENKLENNLADIRKELDKPITGDDDNE